VVNPEYLPSKDFIIKASIVGVILIVLVGAAIFWNPEPEISTDEKGRIIFSKSDKDNDGLRDWEEEVWGTDINNPDTDGDGTPDGEEVLANRDPLQAGSDRLTDARVSSVYNAYKRKSLTAVNITDQISNKILSHSLLLANQLDAGGNINTQNTDLLLQPIIEEYKLDSPKYVVGNIKSIPATKESVVEYFTNILEISNTMINNQAGNEVTLLLEESDLNVDKQARNYEELVNTLRNMSVPAPLASKHLEVLNNFSILQEAFTLLISAQDNDPAKALYALDTIKAVQSRNTQAIEDLSLTWREEVDKLYE